MATKKKTLITMAEYSRRRGCSKPYISKLVSQGIVSLTDGMVDPIEADRQITDYSAQLHPKGEKGEQSLAEWRRRELKVKCALKQMELDTERGLLVNAEELKAELARLFTDIKTILRAIPSKSAGELYHIAKTAKTQHDAMVKISTFMLKEIDAALTTLSQWGKQKKGGNTIGKGPHKQRKGA